MTVYPGLLSNGGIKIVAPASVIWLYCEINTTDTTLSATWLKDDFILVQDVPHIRLRYLTSAQSTTLLLVIDNYGISDNGAYHCSAQTTREMTSGNQIALTGNIVAVDPR